MLLKQIAVEAYALVSIMTGDLHDYRVTMMMQTSGSSGQMKMPRSAAQMRTRRHLTAGAPFMNRQELGLAHVHSEGLAGGRKGGGLLLIRQLRMVGRGGACAGLHSMLGPFLMMTMRWTI